MKVLLEVTQSYFDHLHQRIQWSWRGIHEGWCIIDALTGASAPKPALIPINYTLPFLTHPPAVRTTPKVRRFLIISMSSICRPSLQENVWSEFFSALMFVCWRALLDHCYIFGYKCRGSPKRQTPLAVGKRICFLWSCFQEYVSF